MSRARPIPFLLLAVLACSPKQLNRSDGQSKTVDIPVSCPTRDEAAMRAYDGARDAERQRDVRRAEALYREAVHRDPGYCDAMDNLGLLLRRQGKVDEAIEWYRKSLAVQPTNRAARANLGTALRLKGNADEALREYATMFEHDPDDAEAHYGAGLTYLLKNEPRKALEHFERAEKLYWVQRPELTADATLLKGIAQWQLGDCGNAVKRLESIERTRGDEAELNYILAVCALSEHHDELQKGVKEGTPWLESARAHLRRARSAGKPVDAEMARALRL